MFLPSRHTEYTSFSTPERGKKDTRNGWGLELWLKTGLNVGRTKRKTKPNQTKLGAPNEIQKPRQRRAAFFLS